MTNDYSLPMIPAYITVHLASPYEEGDNVTISFPDYIKGVASATIDGNIPEQAMIAVIYAQISFALNRINSKHYRNMRYSFDITNDTNFDQPFVYTGVVYENINKIVDNIFTEYISYIGTNTPIEARVCYGGTLRCRGLSLEGSIELALNGNSYEEILKYYYGNNIYIEKNAELYGLQTDYLLSYPLNIGDRGKEVSGLQIALNRISSNYTTITRIDDIDGIYNENTARAVADFQRIFDLSVTGNVDKATYHKLMYIYDSVRKLSYLVEEGENLSDIPTVLRADLRYGSIGNSVKLLQYYLLFVSVFEKRVPPLDIIGVFGEKTYQSVVSFQRVFGFTPDGVVTQEVWNTLLAVYEGLYSSLPPSAFSNTAVEYFGNILLIGSEGVEVRYLQEYLNVAAEKFEGLPFVDVNGFFDSQTENAVREFQKMFGIKETGVVSSTTWLALSQIYNAVKAGE